MKTLARFLPLIVALLCAVWLAGKAVPPRDAAGEPGMHGFGRLPVVYQGRVKPFDTLARNSLVAISDRQTFKDAEGKKQPAIRWLLDVMSGAPAAADHKVFRITHFPLQTALGLEKRKRYRYAFSEFEDKLPELGKQASRAFALEPAQRDIYDNKVIEFFRKVQQYNTLAETHRVPHIRVAEEQGGADFQREVRRFGVLERSNSLPHAIPPHTEDEDWKPFLLAMLEGVASQHFNPAVAPLATMLRAWRQGDVQTFNSELARYQTYLAGHPLKEKPALGFEASFNHFAPFYHCAALYVIAFMLGCLAWLGTAEAFGRSAFWLIFMTFGVHTCALAARVYISGYPPITNLYGTAIFIGWGCVLLGLFLESIFRLGIGNIIAAVSGFLTLLIAHFLAGDGDTLQMMQAVLDTKFWLATHVIIINFGYSATFLAGALAVLYLLRGVLTRSLSADMERVFGRMIYGTMCFALLLSFVGTVLGGLWADDSWGRFWGWDPKENGALMIVLWNALILHARWGGMVKTRGIAVLAVFGNIVTSWSWFGVNQLGVGLHSYGFTDSVAFWLILFVLSQLGLIGMGLLPRRVWRSAGASQRVVAKSSAGRRVQLLGEIVN